MPYLSEQEAIHVLATWAGKTYKEALDWVLFLIDYPGSPRDVDATFKALTEGYWEWQQYMEEILRL